MCQPAALSGFVLVECLKDVDAKAAAKHKQAFFVEATGRRLLAAECT
jgi:hypothetical protein